MPNVWRNLEENKALLNKALKTGSFIVFDTETTGFSAEKDFIVEIAACKVGFLNGAFYVKEEFHTYIKSPIHMPERASEVNGITDEFLADKPSEEEVFSQILEFFGNTPAVGAYNSSFDIKMVKALYKRHGQDFEVSVDVDVLKLVKDAFCETPVPNHRLGTIALIYGVDEGLNFHNAMDDVYATIRVLTCIVRDMQNSKGQNEKKSPDLYSASLWKGPRHDQKRIYVTTSCGRYYYDVVKDVWTSTDKKDDIGNVDVEALEKVLFDRYQSTSLKGVASTLEREMVTPVVPEILRISYEENRNASVIETVIGTVTYFPLTGMWESTTKKDSVVDYAGLYSELSVRIGRPFSEYRGA